MRTMGDAIDNHEADYRVDAGPVEVNIAFDGMKRAQKQPINGNLSNAGLPTLGWDNDHVRCNKTPDRSHIERRRYNCKSTFTADEFRCTVCLTNILIVIDCS